MPWINCLWANIKNTSTGKVTITLAAIRGPHSVDWETWKYASASGSVLILSLDITIKGQRKLFHAPIKTNIDSAISADFDSGNIILNSICSLLHPSILAASSRSDGIDRKNSLKGIY